MPDAALPPGGPLERLERGWIASVISMRLWVDRVAHILQECELHIDDKRRPIPLGSILGRRRARGWVCDAVPERRRGAERHGCGRVVRTYRLTSL
eukprot:5863010-Prymnesium_polylepis.2